MRAGKPGRPEPGDNDIGFNIPLVWQCTNAGQFRKCLFERCIQQVETEIDFPDDDGGARHR